MANAFTGPLAPRDIGPRMSNPCTGLIPLPGAGIQSLPVDDSRGSFLHSRELLRTTSRRCGGNHVSAPLASGRCGIGAEPSIAGEQCQPSRWIVESELQLTMASWLLTHCLGFNGWSGNSHSILPRSCDDASVGWLPRVCAPFKGMTSFWASNRVGAFSNAPTADMKRRVGDLKDLGTRPSSHGHPGSPPRKSGYLSRAAVS